MEFIQEVGSFFEDDGEEIEEREVDEYFDFI